MDKEAIKLWVQELFDTEITETEDAIANERAFEAGWNLNPVPDENNPHTENLVTLTAYLELLKTLKQHGLKAAG